MRNDGEITTSGSTNRGHHTGRRVLPDAQASKDLAMEHA